MMSSCTSLKVGLYTVSAILLINGRFDACMQGTVTSTADMTWKKGCAPSSHEA